MKKKRVGWTSASIARQVIIFELLMAEIEIAENETTEFTEKYSVSSQRVSF